MPKVHFLRWLSQVLALIGKEFKQIMRDPSSYLVAFILPIILLLCFGYAISMDAGIMQLAFIDESRGALSQELGLAFEQSPHFDLHMVPARKVASQMMGDSKVQGVLIIPSNFDTLLASGQNSPVQLLIDGSEPNTANFIRSHSEGTVNNWQLTRMNGGAMQRMPIEIQSSIWFNSSAKSRWALLPGSITVIMTLIGTVLTSLVITREWERGTMEAMYATPVTRMQIFLGKLIPYYFLAMASMALCTVFSHYLFGVPFRGSVGMLVLLTTFFLMPALGQGLFISSLFRSQLLSAMIGFLSGMLPSFILSGLIFDINSMPMVLQYVTTVIPAKYFNVCLQTIFLAGDIPSVFLPRMAYMMALGLLFFALAYRNLKKRLD